MGDARYDGFAEAYDAFLSANAAYYAVADDALRRLLGEGSGRCLDLGCGGGRALQTLIGLEWTPVGVDESSDQLRIARRRHAHVELVQSNARPLPFGDATFEAAISTFTHTDTDHFRELVQEVFRVLKPGARFVYVGNHPCFIGATQEQRDSGIPVLHPGYRNVTRWHAVDAPGIRGVSGWRATLGTFVHLPLAEFLSAFGGFALQSVEELEDGWEYPRTIALAFAKPRA